MIKLINLSFLNLNYDDILFLKKNYNDIYCNISEDIYYNINDYCIIKTIYMNWIQNEKYPMMSFNKFKL